MNLQFSPAHKVIIKDDNWRQNFDQFTSVHFPDLNLNSYHNLSNMKLDLNVSIKVKFSPKDKGI